MGKNFKNKLNAEAISKMESKLSIKIKFLPRSLNKGSYHKKSICKMERQKQKKLPIRMVLPSLHHQVKLSIMQNYQTHRCWIMPDLNLQFRWFFTLMKTWQQWKHLSMWSLHWRLCKKITKKTELSDKAFNLLKLLHHHEWDGPHFI